MSLNQKTHGRLAKEEDARTTLEVAHGTNMSLRSADAESAYKIRERRERFFFQQLKFDD